jgi:hypothetical protein
MTGVGITAGRENVAADEQANDESQNQGADERIFALHEILSR